MTRYEELTAMILKTRSNKKLEQLDEAIECERRWGILTQEEARSLGAMIDYRRK